MTARVVKETATRAVNLHQRRPDPHGDRQYTDDGLATHEALQSDPDDVHGSKTYTDAQLAAHETAALNTFSWAGYGGLVTTAPIALPDIGAGWTTLEFDDLSVLVPRAVSADLFENTLEADAEGVWVAAITGSLLHNEVNAARVFDVRSYNVTDGVPISNGIRVFVGRNQGGSNIAFNLLFDIGPSQVDKAFRIEVGGTLDAFTSVDWDGEFSMFNVGEWRGTL